MTTKYFKLHITTKCFQSVVILHRDSVATAKLKLNFMSRVLTWVPTSCIVMMKKNNESSVDRCLVWHKIIMYWKRFSTSVIYKILLNPTWKFTFSTNSKCCTRLLLTLIWSYFFLLCTGANLYVCIPSLDASTSESALILASNSWLFMFFELKLLQIFSWIINEIQLGTCISHTDLFKYVVTGAIN